MGEVEVAVRIVMHQDADAIGVASHLKMHGCRAAIGVVRLVVDDKEREPFHGVDEEQMGGIGPQAWLFAVVGIIGNFAVSVISRGRHLPGVRGVDGAQDILIEVARPRPRLL